MMPMQRGREQCFRGFSRKPMSICTMQSMMSKCLTDHSCNFLRVFRRTWRKSYLIIRRRSNVCRLNTHFNCRYTCPEFRCVVQCLPSIKIFFFFFFLTSIFSSVYIVEIDRRTTSNTSVSLIVLRIMGYTLYVRPEQEFPGLISCFCPRNQSNQTGVNQNQGIGG